MALRGSSGHLPGGIYGQHTPTSSTMACWYTPIDSSYCSRYISVRPVGAYQHRLSILVCNQLTPYAYSLKGLGLRAIWPAKIWTRVLRLACCVQRTDPVCSSATSFTWLVIRSIPYFSDQTVGGKCSHENYDYNVKIWTPPIKKVTAKITYV